MSDKKLSISNEAISPLRKKDTSVDHRGHTGPDRTPAQKRGDRQSAETRKNKGK